MTTTIEYKEFTTVAQFIEAVKKLAGCINLDDIYMKDLCGDDITEVSLEQETLSDGSVVFNLVLSEALDPNS